jgi:hypothetical protein
MPPDPGDPPLFPRARTVADAETIARAFGVAADYGRQLRIANAVNEALAILATRGVRVPAPISVDPYPFVRGGQVQRDIVGTYDERDGIIRFNPFARYWSNPDREARQQYELRWWATDHPLAPVFHEVGHALHLAPVRSVPVAGDWSSERDRRVAREVSVFAETAPSEFVAEVFTVLIAGGEIDPDVRALYLLLGGPVP